MLAAKQLHNVLSNETSQINYAVLLFFLNIFSGKSFSLFGNTAGSGNLYFGWHLD